MVMRARGRRSVTAMSTALITGASRGLGLALARALAARGWRLVIDARGAGRSRPPAPSWRPAPRSSRSPATSPTPSTAARSSPPRARASTCSSTTPASWARARSRRSPTTRSTSSSASTASTCSRRWRSIQLALPALADGARIVNVTSDAAVEAYAGWGGYGSAKAALDQLDRDPRRRAPGLRVYAVDPGDMNTRMHQAAFPGEDISDRPPPEASVPGLLALARRRAAQRPLRRARAGGRRGVTPSPAFDAARAARGRRAARGARARARRRAPAGGAPRRRAARPRALPRPARPPRRRRPAGRQHAPPRCPPR